MNFSLPELPNDVSRNAHIIYKAQSDHNTVLKVDNNGNLQRVGSVGRFFTSIADAFTFGKFSVKRALEVQDLSIDVLSKLNEHLDRVEKAIDEQKPDLDNVDVQQKIRSAINITPPRPLRLTKTAVCYEPMYEINPTKLDVYDLLKNRITSITYAVLHTNTRIDTASDSVAPSPEVLQAQVCLKALKIAADIKDINPQCINDDSYLNLDDKNELHIFDIVHVAKQAMNDWKTEQERSAWEQKRQKGDKVQ